MVEFPAQLLNYLVIKINHFSFKPKPPSHVQTQFHVPENFLQRNVRARSQGLVWGPLKISLFHFCGHMKEGRSLQAAREAKAWQTHLLIGFIPGS